MLNAGRKRTFEITESLVDLKKLMKQARESWIYRRYLVLYMLKKDMKILEIKECIGIEESSIRNILIGTKQKVSKGWKTIYQVENAMYRAK